MKMKTQVQGILVARDEVCREYAFPGGRGTTSGREKADFGREREKLKEQLLAYVRETVRKQWKEERDYYRSRPSMAAKQLSHVIGAGNLAQMIVPAVSDRVYEQMEERVRLEWIRKGR